MISASFLTSKNIPLTLTKLNKTDVDLIHVDVKDNKYVKGKSYFTQKRILVIQMEYQQQMNQSSYHNYSYY